MFPKTLALVILAVSVNHAQKHDDSKSIMKQIFDIMGGGFKLENSQDEEGEEYDFVIIGAGSAGSVLANRLSEVNDWKILVLETGGPETNFSKTPLMAPFVQFTSQSWAFKTEPEKFACQGIYEKKCNWHRGKGLGGTSATNFMLYYRGNPEDYNRLAMKNPGWSYDEVLPYFLKSEGATFDSDPVYHNRAGNLQVTILPQSNLTNVFIEAGVELGYKEIDPNTRESIGFSKVYATVKGNMRHSAFSAFLEPVMRRKNLKVITHARVTKILIDPASTQAYGVQYIWKDKKVIVRIKKEVLLSAGVLNSPQLLMLSGIGPQQHLKDLGIAPIVDIPVGQTLYDHVINFGILLETNHSMIEDFFSKKNDLISVPLTGGIGYIATAFSDNAQYPDIELHLMPTTFVGKLGQAARKLVGLTEEIYNKMYKELESKNTFAILPKLIRPRSVGYLRLRSADPFDHPLFYPNYFSDKEGIDKKVMISGIRFVHRLAQTEALKKFDPKIFDKPFIGCEDYKYGSDDYWNCTVGSMSISGFHQTSTCKMGPKDDPTAIVDHDLQVYGVKGLRVVDGSVIPEPNCAHLNAPTIMIGEKAADLIKEKWGELHANSVDRKCNDLIKT